MTPLIGLALGLCLPAFQTGAAAQEALLCPIEGAQVIVGRLANGEQAFGNRTYVWQDVPDALQGWQFTRLDGGGTALLRIASGYEGPVYLATSAQGRDIDLTGWEPVDGWRFGYSDAGQTRLTVYRNTAPGQGALPIPQGGWTGGIVLAPRIEVRDVAVEPDFSAVPGVVIDHAPAASKRYVGSPSLAVLSDGTYVASHDWFGPATTEHKQAVTRVLASTDRGQTWQPRGEINGQFWSNLFVRGDALYILGTYAHYGNLVIRRSDDGGATWTEPVDAASGLLREGRFHCAPMPVIEHEGRLWRAFEDTTNPLIWGRSFRVMMLSAPVDADMLKASSWTLSQRMPGDAQWLDGGFGGWLEGNAVVTPAGQMVDILRVDVPSDAPEQAAVVHFSADAQSQQFDPARDFLPFPGGAKKFVIRFDPPSKRYWALATPAAPVDRGTTKPGGIRNTLALVSSADLTSWRIDCILARHPDVKKHGFQYPDWLFDGADIIAVVRTAHDDGLGGARNNHDANFMTFHRIQNFRDVTPADSVVDPASLGFE